MDLASREYTRGTADISSAFPAVYSRRAKYEFPDTLSYFEFISIEHFSARIGTVRCTVSAQRHSTLW